MPYLIEADGTFTVARRPHLQGGGREFFATVTQSEIRSNLEEALSDFDQAVNCIRDAAAELRSI